MDLLDLLSNACIFFTIVMFSTGIPQCLQMVKKRSTENIPFLPYLMTNFNNLTWILYSTLTNNWTVYIVNVIGSILQTIYMFFYFLYCPIKFRAIMQTFAASTCLILCYIYVNLFQTDKEVSKNVMGILCVGVTILMFSSPLAELKTVMENRSTESLSLPLAVASFLCGGLWTMYGFVLGDMYIVIPNCMGVLTSLPRFVFFYMYAEKDQKKPTLYPNSYI